MSQEKIQSGLDAALVASFNVKAGLLREQHSDNILLCEAIDAAFGVVYRNGDFSKETQDQIMNLTDDEFKETLEKLGVDAYNHTQDTLKKTLEHLPVVRVA